MIGIIGAMEIEVDKLQEKMTDKEEINFASLNFVKGKLQGKDVVVVRSGIGKVNAAMCTQILVDKFLVDTVINTGIAGGVYKDIKIGDIVIGSRAVQSDMNSTAFGFKIGEMPGMDIRYFPLDKNLAELAVRKCKEINTDINVYLGTISTGDRFVAGRELKESLREEFDAYCTEMEGASIAHVAYLNSIKCLIIRAISDNASDDASGLYEEFEAKAAKHCSDLTLSILNDI